MILTVRVQPGAKNDKIVGFLADGSLKLRVAAPPEDGRANERVRLLLASTTNISKQDVVIISGHTARVKRIQIPERAQNDLTKQFSHVQALDLFRPTTKDDSA